MIPGKIVIFDNFEVVHKKFLVLDALIIGGQPSQPQILFLSRGLCSGVCCQDRDEGRLRCYGLRWPKNELINFFLRWSDNRNWRGFIPSGVLNIAGWSLATIDKSYSQDPRSLFRKSKSHCLFDSKPSPLIFTESSLRVSDSGPSVAIPSINAILNCVSSKWVGP